MLKLQYFFTHQGYYTLPVSCLIQPSPARLLRPVDELFVESLKSAMKSNPSTDVAPIVGIVLLPEGEQFQETQKESYQYETIGGNNSRAALADLVENEDNPIFRTRLVSVYHGLTDTEALRLAARHNSATSLHHAMTTWEKVRPYTFLVITCTSLYYNLKSNQWPFCILPVIIMHVVNYYTNCCRFRCAELWCTVCQTPKQGMMSQRNRRPGGVNARQCCINQ